ARSRCAGACCFSTCQFCLAVSTASRAVRFASASASGPQLVERRAGGSQRWSAPTATPPAAVCSHSPCGASWLAFVLGGPALAWLALHSARRPCCRDGDPPPARLVSCLVGRPLQANAGRSSAPPPAPACPLAPTTRPPAPAPAAC